jgi:hypothetical protein
MSNQKKYTMKKLAFLLFLTILFVGCSEDKLITVNGIASGYVKDIVTNQFLEGVLATYIIQKDTFTVTTNAGGYFYITGLPAGYTSIYFSKEGYALTHQQAWIEPLADATLNKDGGTAVYYEDLEVFMPALNGGLKGTIMKYVGPDNEIRPAEGFTVQFAYRAESGADYVPSSYETTVDSLGAFSFTNLPTGINALLTVKPISDGYNYYFDDYNLILIPNSTYEFNTVMNNTENRIRLVSTSLDSANGSYVYNFPINGRIVLVFNKEVSKVLTARDGGVSLSTFGSLDLDIDVTFDGYTVTVVPPAILLNDQDYTLGLNIYSTIPGDYYQDNITFHTEP